MPRTSHDANQVLTQLERSRNRLGPGHAGVLNKLLAAVSKFNFTDPHQLNRFHECLLFLRAFSYAPSHIPRVERLLNTFHQRIEKLRSTNADLSIFDDFDTSGIAGTIMQDTLSFDVVQWLVRRIPHNVEIAWDDYWDDYASERPRGSLWPRFIPLLQEDADVEANIPWQRWLDAARGHENPLLWLVTCFERLQLPERERSELYDSLRLPIRWKLENLKLSRTRNWTRPRRFYFHTAPLIQRSEVSLSRELSQPAPKFEKLTASAGEAVMHSIREVMVVRYRELYGTTLGDPRFVVRTDLGRGVVMHFWGLPSTRRLPLRAYLAGFTLKNGVPINYVEAIGLCEWIEVGFNTFYTYRQGETAWIYAQALRCLRALTSAKWISIYPYQIGQNNDEAIDSGAFWFYRKLGFRPGRADLQKLCEREEEKIAADPQYRTPRRTLKRLAEAHMFFKIQETENGPNSYADQTGPWDAFSSRNLGLLVSRRMAREFNGDIQKIRQASITFTTRALNINPSRWTQVQRESLENWSLLLALLPGLSGWSPREKQLLIRLIRAKSSPNEMTYLHKTQRHPRLRGELLRIGSRRFSS
jgi:hypothetical protein